MGKTNDQYAARISILDVLSKQENWRQMSKEFFGILWIRFLFLPQCIAN